MFCRWQVGQVPNLPYLPTVIKLVFSLRRGVGQVGNLPHTTKHYLESYNTQPPKPINSILPLSFFLQISFKPCS